MATRRDGGIDQAKKYRLWRAVDPNGYILDTILQSRGSLPNA
jgi:transposase-like protein